MMNTAPLEPSRLDQIELLQTHLSEAGREELYQLESLLSDDPEAFALFIVRSDFDTETRDALLQQLAENLSPTEMVTVALNNERFDVPLLLHEAAAQTAGAAFFALTGLEETPNLISAPGEAPARPPALALLNHGREAIRRVEHPVLLWCDPIAYAALREHAPDFFDHYTALFDFLDAAPSTLASSELFDSSLMPNGKPRMVSAISPRPISPEAVRFYTEQVERFQEPTADRVRALMGLADALFGLSNSRFSRNEKFIEALLREALQTAQSLGMYVEVARIQVLLSSTLNRQRREGEVTSPEVKKQIIDLAEQSLRVLDETKFPLEWAATQWALGNFYWETAAEDSERRRAIPYLQAAQRVWTKEKHPHFWASTEMNLGHIFLDLLPTPGNLKRAVSHLERALEGFRKADQPEGWALIQMMLARAYSLMANLTGDDKSVRSRHLRRSIVSHQAASHVFMQIKEPQNVALALASEGLIWRDLPTGNRREHLRQSANCFLKSAEQLKQARDSQGRALQLEMAAQTLMKLAELTKSSREVQEALQAYDAAHQSFAEASDFSASQRMEQMAGQLHMLLQKAQSKTNS